METLALHTGAPTINWEENTSCISVFKAKRVTPLVLKNWTFLSIFYNNNLTMVYLFQNMRSLVSCRQIFAPNHVQIQSSSRVLNG